jgi:hypothetical protein
MAFLAALLAAILLAAPSARPAPESDFEYVHGRRLHRFGSARPERLARPLFAPLLGSSTALVVPSPSGEEILYHAWEPSGDQAGVPVLRIYSGADGSERVLARGAQSAAWRQDGAVAYMQATVPRYAPTPTGTFGGRYGQVVVRASPAAPAVRWTTEQRRQYVVLGWARRKLLVEILPSNLRRDRRPPGVYALDGPSRLRRLPLRQLVAIAPDGRRALGSSGDGDAPSRSVRLVDLRTGRILSSLRLDNAGVQGDWVGDTAVVVGGPRTPVLAIVRVAGDMIALEQRLHVPAASLALSPFLSRPVFVGVNRSVVVRVEAAGPTDAIVYSGFARCDLGTGRCTRGPDLRPAGTWAAGVDNPSRPD